MMPSLRHRHGDVPALAFEHVDVVAEVGGLDLDLGEIDRRRCGGRGCGVVAARMRCRPAEGDGNRRYVQSESSKTSPSPYSADVFLAQGAMRLPSCGPAGRACLNAVREPGGEALQDAVRRARRGNQAMTSPIAGGVDCDLHPAVPHLTSLLPYLERLLARPGDDARHDRPGLAILSDQFADLVAAGLAAGAGQAGLEPRRHAEAGARSRSASAYGICNPLYGVQMVFSEDMAGRVLPRAERLAGQGMARQGCAAARLDRDPACRASRNRSPRSSAAPGTSASSRC